MSHPAANLSDNAALPTRRFRFGLRTFLLLATIVSVALGLWSLAAVRQKNLVSAVRAHGGMVDYDFQFDAHGNLDPFLPPPSLARWLGVDAVARIETITLDARVADDEFLKILADGPEASRYVVVHYLFEPPTVEEKLAELFPDANIGTIHSYDGGIRGAAVPLR